MSARLVKQHTQNPQKKPAMDTMSVMRVIKVEETFKEWFKKVIKFTLQSNNLKPLSIGYANDVYRGISAKNCSRDEKGQSETRVHLQSLVFFHNIKDKEHLFSLFVTCLCADDFVQLNPLPILVNYENDTFKISFECNHEEANTRMIFHALQQKIKCSTTFKRYGYPCFDGLCLSS